MAEYQRTEIEDQFSRRESLRKTLLNTLRTSTHDLTEIIAYGTVREAQAFAQLAEDGPSCAEVLRHTAQLIEFASERINEAILQRRDAMQLVEYNKAHLRKGLL